MRSTAEHSLHACVPSLAAASRVTIPPATVYLSVDYYMVVIQGKSAIRNTSYDMDSRTSYAEQCSVLLWLSFEYIVHWLENWEKCTMERWHAANYFAAENDSCLVSVLHACFYCCSSLPRVPPKIKVSPSFS